MIGWDICKRGIEIVLGNGKTTSFWFEKWLPNGKFVREQIQGPLREEECKLRVGDIIHKLGGSTPTPISFELPQEIMLLEHSTYITSTSNKSDTIIWKPNSKGILTTSSVYKFLQKNEPGYQKNTVNSNWIWSLNCPNKINILSSFVNIIDYQLGVISNQ